MDKRDVLNLYYSLVPITLSGMDGFRRVPTHVGGRDHGTIFKDAAAKIPGQTAVGVELAWNSLMSSVMDYLAKYQYKVMLDGMTFELAIPGSTESVNAIPTEGVYVAITPSDAIRNAAADVTPVFSSEESDVPVVRRVENLSSHKTGELDVVEKFRVGGNNLTVAGEGEGLKVVAADGTEATAEVDAEDGLGRYIEARLSAVLPPGKGKVVLTTRGWRTPEGELRPCVKSVTILAGEPTPPPEPTPIAQTSDGEVKVMSLSGGHEGVYTLGDTWTAQGEGFRDSAAGWFVELGMLLPTPSAEPVNLDCQVTSPTAMEIGPSESEELAAGDYPNAAVQIGMAHYVDGELVSETLELPIHLTVA